MFARVSTFQGSPDKETNVLSGPPPAEIQARHGFKGVFSLQNSKTGKVMLITLWETEEDLLASAQVANRTRAETVKDSGGIGEAQVETFKVLYHPEFAAASPTR